MKGGQSWGALPGRDAGHSLAGLCRSGDSGRGQLRAAQVGAASQPPVLLPLPAPASPRRPARPGKSLCRGSISSGRCCVFKDTFGGYTRDFIY